MNEPVRIVDYDAEWGTLFELEQRLILSALPAGSFELHHVGSTAVPGLASKPIIDLILAVPQLSSAAELIPQLESLGYLYQPDSGEHDRLYLRKGSPRSHHLHIVEQGSESLVRHLAFRDYLRTHPEKAQEYGELKKRLATELGDDREAYTNAKSEFIFSCVEQALSARKAGTRTLLLLYPGCIPFEIMMAAELIGEELPIDVATPDGSDYRAANGIVYRAQFAYDDVQVNDYRCVLVPGGDPYDIMENRTIESLLQLAQSNGTVVGAICAGPLLLAKSGLLKGKLFTHGYGDFHQEFLAPFWEGAHFSNEPIVIDGRIVTAQPQAHVDFGVEVARMTGLIDPERAEELKSYYKGRPIPA